MLFSAPTAFPVASYSAEAKPPLERSSGRRTTRREVVLGLMAIAVMTLTMIAVKIVRGELRSEDAAGDLTQPAANAPTSQPAIVILPTDIPTQAPASETAEVTILAETVASNAVEFSVPAAAGLTDIVWDFGDGATAPEASSVHTYAVPGVYTVRMTATGPDGNEVATSAEITVIEGCILTPRQGDAQIYAAPVTIHVITTLGTIPEGSQLFTAESRRGQDGFIWYRVTHNGTAGWAHSSAMRAVSGKCP